MKSCRVKSFRFLTLDSSTPYIVVAIGRQNQLLGGERHHFQKGRSEGLIHLVSLCLKKSKLDLKKIDCFGVGVGPGSFTGLRIGLSTAKALSYAFEKPCFIFSSLDAIAYNAISLSYDRVVVVVDARRGNVYSRFYEMRHGILKRSTQDLLITQKEWEKRVGELGDQRIAFCGDAVKLIKKDLEKKSKKFSFLDEKYWYPTLKSVARLTQEAVETKKPLDAFRLAATYLYEQDCQVSRGAFKC